MSVVTTIPCPVRKIGQSVGHHFFGYYNKSVWDRGGQRMLALRVPRMAWDLAADDVAEVGYFDLADGETFRTVDTTTAWNWQMGTQLQWLEGLPGRKLIFNRRVDDVVGAYPGLRARILDIDDGTSIDLPDPVYVVAPDSSYAICVDYMRFAATHPTIGYVPAEPAPELALAPADDGIRRMELPGGESRLLLSLADLKAFRPVASMEGAIHWVTHLEINPVGDQVLFLHRWTRRIEDETCWLHRLLVVNSDGTGLKLVGGRLLPGPRAPAAFLMYEGPSGERYTLYTSRASTPAAQMRYATQADDGALYWADRGIGYVLTGPDGNKARLEQVARAVYDQTEKTGG